MVDSLVEKSPETSGGVLTPEYAGRILFRSYEHSQGNSEFQELLFQYLHLIRPKWQIDNKGKELIESLVKPRIINYLEPVVETHSLMTHAVHKDLVEDRKGEMPGKSLEAQVMADLPEQILVMKEELNGDIHPTQDRRTLVRLIFEAVVERDLNFIWPGRQRVGLDPKTPKGDPYFSFLVHYALRGNPTGIEEFDQMYRDIKEFIADMRTVLPRLRDLLALYNEKHPDSPVELP